MIFVDRIIFVRDPINVSTHLVHWAMKFDLEVFNDSCFVHCTVVNSKCFSSHNKELIRSRYLDWKDVKDVPTEEMQELEVYSIIWIILVVSQSCYLLASIIVQCDAYFIKSLTKWRVLSSASYLLNHRDGIGKTNHFQCSRIK